MIAIIVKSGSDAMECVRLLETVLSSAGSKVTIIFNTPTSKGVEGTQVNLFIEHIPELALRRYPASENWLLVTPWSIKQWDFDALKWMDKVLCLSTYSHSLMLNLKRQYQWKCEVVRIGTAISLFGVDSHLASLEAPKPFFGHFAGSHAFFKSTRLLMKALLEDKELR